MIFYNRTIDEDIVLLIILDFLILCFVCYCVRLFNDFSNQNNNQDE